MAEADLPVLPTEFSNVFLSYPCNLYADNPVILLDTEENVFLPSDLPLPGGWLHGFYFMVYTFGLLFLYEFLHLWITPLCEKGWIELFQIIQKPTKKRPFIGKEHLYDLPFVTRASLMHRSLMSSIGLHPDSSLEKYAASFKKYGIYPLVIMSLPTFVMMLSLLHLIARNGDMDSYSFYFHYHLAHFCLPLKYPVTRAILSRIFCTSCGVWNLLDLVFFFYIKPPLSKLLLDRLILLIIIAVPSVLLAYATNPLLFTDRTRQLVEYMDDDTLFSPF